jgi:hypothetical protein
MPLRAHEALAWPTQAIVIGYAVIDALGALPVDAAWTTALLVVDAGFAETLTIYKEATDPVVHDQFRIALALPVDAILIAAPRAIDVRAAALFRNAFLAAFLFALGTTLLFALVLPVVLLVLGRHDLVADPGEQAPQRQTEHGAAGRRGGHGPDDRIETITVHDTSFAADTWFHGWLSIHGAAGPYSSLCPRRGKLTIPNIGGEPDTA